MCLLVCTHVNILEFRVPFWLTVWIFCVRACSCPWMFFQQCIHALSVTISLCSHSFIFSTSLSPFPPPLLPFFLLPSSSSPLLPPPFPSPSLFNSCLSLNGHYVYLLTFQREHFRWGYSGHYQYSDTCYSWSLLLWATACWQHWRILRKRCLQHWPNTRSSSNRQTSWLEYQFPRRWTTLNELWRGL